MTESPGSTEVQEPANAPKRADPGGWHATPFVPRRFLSNGHVQTIIGNFVPRSFDLPPANPELVEVSSASGSQMASQVLCDCHWQPEKVRAERPTAIIVHGLEGSSNSKYMRGNAAKFWAAGANVVRMNMRNCGGRNYEMARLTPTLYHSGLSGDVDAVMRFFIQRERLQCVALVGYSMGGNLVMKLAGELATEAPPELRAVVGVSPAVDLGPSADALSRPVNAVYQRHFLRALLKRFRRKVMLFPRVYDPNRADGVRSLREFDDRITALYSGFFSADDYYDRASAARVVGRIAVPTLILHSLDDPFVRIVPQTLRDIEANPNITLVLTEHGGHCSFLATPNRDVGNDGYWAEKTLVDFVLTHA